MVLFYGRAYNRDSFSKIFYRVVFWMYENVIFVYKLILIYNPITVEMCCSIICLQLVRISFQYICLMD